MILKFQPEMSSELFRKRNKLLASIIGCTTLWRKNWLHFFGKNAAIRLSPNFRKGLGFQPRHFIVWNNASRALRSAAFSKS
jgi:hypothetical protein